MFNPLATDFYDLSNKLLEEKYTELRKKILDDTKSASASSNGYTY